MAITSRITVHKIMLPQGFNIDFGADLGNASLENICEVDVDVIRSTVYEFQVIVFKHQRILRPRA
ncbi:hypothetical protein LTR53_017524, partial [Teratosphaeriaceae sp. CCFEE 6253]